LQGGVVGGIGHGDVLELQHENVQKYALYISSLNNSARSR
jgi:hypothetical protein